MARRTAVRHALKVVPWPSPVLLDSCHPSGRGRRVKAREATACGLALTRRTRPRQSSSEEDARRLHPLRPEAGMSDVALPEKRKVGSSTLPLTTNWGLVFSALTSVNAAQPLPCRSPSSDYGCPCVTVVGRSLSHADRTTRLPASGPRHLRSELAVALVSLADTHPSVFKPGICRVGTDRASVMSCRWSLLPAVDRCCRCRPPRRGGLSVREQAVRMVPESRFHLPYSACPPKSVKVGHAWVVALRLRFTSEDAQL